MPNGVSCSVSSCTFWEENNRCIADFIHIKTDEEANYNEEFSTELAHSVGEKVRESAETCCQTFRPKDETHE